VFGNVRSGDLARAELGVSRTKRYEAEQSRASPPGYLTVFCTP